MADAQDDQSTKFDRALTESQRQERADLAADLERQRRADEHLLDALSAKNRDLPDPSAQA